MNPLVAKALPYLGYPLAALMFFFWLGLKEDLAQQVELCNQQKLQSVAEAERLTRETLQASLDRRLRELEAAALAESEARRIAEAARLRAEAGAQDAQDTIRRLTAEARGAENATIEQECLLTAVPVDLVSILRGE